MERPSLNKILGKLEQQEMSAWKSYSRGSCSPLFGDKPAYSSDLHSNSSDFFITVDSFDFILLSPSKSKNKSKYYSVEVKANSNRLFEPYHCSWRDSEFKKLGKLCGKIRNYALSMEMKEEERQINLLNKTLDS